MNNNTTRAPVNANTHANGGPRAARPLTMAEAVALKWIERYAPGPVNAGIVVNVVVGGVAHAIRH